MTVELSTLGSVIKTAYEAEADTNAYTDAEKTKLAGVEAAADVTDTANVTAAGALMDSEVTNLAQVKAFDSSDYATAAHAHEGTAILSTGELGGTKFLREDGDGTCSWQSVPGAGGDLLADGTVPLTADWDVGSFDITAAQFHSDIATGTAPFTVASTTVVTNLNADTVDGSHASAFATSAQGALADSALQNVSEDTTPTLGGDLDANGQNVTNLGDVTFQTGAAGGTLRTGTSNADKFTLQAYDVDGSAYVTLLEADAGNDVRLQLPVNYLDLEDATDTTKIARLSSASITTGTTRTFTFPDATGTFALADNIEGTDILSTGPVTDGYVLTADGAGGAAWEAGGGAVDWSTTQTSNLSAATGDEVAFDLSSTVNKATSGNYTGLKLNVTETSAPGTDDRLLDLRVGGTSVLHVTNAGDIYFGSGTNHTIRPNHNSTAGLQFRNDGQGTIAYLDEAGNYKLWFRSEAGLSVHSGAYIGFSSAAAATGSVDTILFRDAAANLAQRNSTNAQTFRVYNTYTDASNYERIAINGAGSIVVETAGTGTDDIDLTLTPAGAGVVKFGTHSAIAAETVTGYITIKTADGTTRKLAVVS